MARSYDSRGCSQRFPRLAPRRHQTRTARIQIRVRPERRGNRFVQRRGRSELRAVKLLARLFGRGVRANVEDCIHIAGVNIAVRLTKKYAHKYDRYDIDKVSALAAAVTNELFGAPPGNEMGRQ